MRDCTICVAKTKADQLVCTFVFAYVDCWFSDVAAHFIITCLGQNFSSEKF